MERVRKGDITNQDSNFVEPKIWVVILMPVKNVPLTKSVTILAAIDTAQLAVRSNVKNGLQDKRKNCSMCLIFISFSPCLMT